MNDELHRTGPETPVERRLRAALAARAEQITAHDLRPAAPPSGPIRHIHRTRRIALLLSGLAAAAAVCVFFLLPGGPFRPEPAPPAKSPSVTPTPSPTSAPIPSTTGSPPGSTPSPSISPSSEPNPTPTFPTGPGSTGAPEFPETPTPRPSTSPRANPSPTPGAGGTARPNSPSANPASPAASFAP